MRSQRQLRVGEAIRHALAAILQRGDVPWPKGFKPPMITVTEVTTSPDLRVATVYYLAMGSENGEEGKKLAKMLEEINGFLRHELASAVKMRYVPELTFSADNSFTYAGNIERILSDPAVAKDLKAPEKTETEEA